MVHSLTTYTYPDLFTHNAMEGLVKLTVCSDVLGHWVGVKIWAKCIYSGTPLNRHPSKADTHDITDNSESPNCPPIHFYT